MKILIVEDDPVTRKATAEWLTAQGHRVWAAPDAEEAKELQRKERLSPDLLIIDVRLPGQSGSTYIRNNIDPRAKPWIIITTALPDARLPEWCDRVLIKPFPLHALTQAIEEIGAQRSAERTT